MLCLLNTVVEVSGRIISKQLCLGLTTLPPLCADCLEILEPQAPRTLNLSRPVQGFLYLSFFTLFYDSYHMSPSTTIVLHMFAEWVTLI
jgi:hypothetical protein